MTVNELITFLESLSSEQREMTIVDDCEIEITHFHTLWNNQVMVCGGNDVSCEWPDEMRKP